MVRMNTNNGFWSYFWSVITGICATLTLQDVLFAGGFIVSGFFAWLTYRSNDRKNKAAIEEDRKRTEILKLAVASSDAVNIPEAARIVKDIDAAISPEPEHG
ncbi:hypothetical protein IB231_16110 [Pantoea sp. PNT02]|uniref:hypothetical protein n=1 Tax=Pantoea sp. PNT02 TaxID=2769261 RepID=UPI0017809955|nr:hypothetical protein [Pantoea sp. PNT02]MBD9645148.1 hypothetical protein [Pantoea sp. PNT02]